MGYVEDLMLRYYFQNKSLLPDGFLECEYLESTGEQYIDTGIFPSNDTRINFKTSFNGNNWSFFGCRGSTTETIFQFYYYNSAFNFRFGTNAAVIAKNIAINTIYDVSIGKISGQTGVIAVDGVYKTKSNYSLTTAGNSLSLFADNRNGAYSTNAKNAKIYFFNVSEDGINTLKFISALCKKGCVYTDGNTGQIVTASANKPGMFDTVTNKFFVNQGTAEFNYKLKED